MDKTRPIYWKLLISVAVIYIIFATVMFSDIYLKIGKIEEALAHQSAAHGHKH